MRSRLKLISLVVIFSALFLFSNFLDIAEIKSISMRPSLKSGEKILYSSIYFSNINKGDVLLFKHNEDLIIKRCVGMPGEAMYFLNSNYSLKSNLNSQGIPSKLQIPKKGLVIKSNSITKYKDIIEKIENGKIESCGDTFYLHGKPLNTYIFKNDFFFFEGDNTSYSTDSRKFGPISDHSIVGKMLFKIF